MILPLTRRYVYALIASLVFTVTAIVWTVLPDSCETWKERIIDVLVDPHHGLNSPLFRQVESERPEGCTFS